MALSLYNLKIALSSRSKLSLSGSLLDDLRKRQERRYFQMLILVKIYWPAKFPLLMTEMQFLCKQVNNNL